MPPDRPADRLVRIERLLVQLNRRLKRIEDRPQVPPPPVHNHVHLDRSGLSQAVAPDAETQGGRRPKGCAADIQQYLRTGSHFFSEVLDRMRSLGHSETTTRDHLKQLVKLGLVAHATKGDPYSIPHSDDDEP